MEFSRELPWDSPESPDATIPFFMEGLIQYPRSSPANLSRLRIGSSVVENISIPTRKIKI
jgi:hypothetical protein